MGVLTRTAGRGRRGIVVAVIAALHGLAIAGLAAHRGFREPPAPEPEPVQVVVVDRQDPTPEPPHDPAAPSLDFVPVSLDLPVILVPDAPPAPAAITVSAPPPQPVAPTPPADGEDLPALVDAVDYLEPPRPRYPPDAKRSRVEGTVVVRVVIGPDGEPRDVRVHRSSGHPQLDTAACDSLRRARFRPHRRNGVAQAAQVLVPIEFALAVRTAGHHRGERRQASRVE